MGIQWQFATVMLMNLHLASYAVTVPISIKVEKELIFMLNECQLSQRAPCIRALVRGKRGSSGQTLDLEHVTKEE